MPAPRYVVVDDTDSSIEYSGPWFQDTGSQDGVGNYGPAYKSTMHGTQANASFSFAFAGSRVLVIGSTNRRNASGVLDPSWQCFVDNTGTHTTGPVLFPENNWVFCEQDLIDGLHILTVNATVLESQTFWFDSIQYIPSPSVSLDQSAVLVDSLDPQLQFGPGWQALADSANMTTIQGSVFAFDFVGVSLAWYGFIPTELPHNETTASYSIDGGPPTTFFLKGLPPDAVTTYNQKFFETSTLSPGPHKIIVTYNGNPQVTPLTLDYLIVQNGTIAASGTAGGSNTNHQSKTSNTGAIVGDVVGGVVFIAIAIAIVVVIYLRRREKRQKVESSEGVVQPFQYNANETTPSQRFLAANNAQAQATRRSLTEKTRREVEATTAVLLSTPPFSDDSGSGIVSHDVPLHSDIVHVRDGPPTYTSQ